jgi:CheY-like chemotaxis protein
VRKRALLIDRYPNARSTLRTMLSTIGVTTVHTAGTSAEVLRQVKANSFDIILSDYQLEDGRDGQQLLDELRQQHLVRWPPSSSSSPASAPTTTSFRWLNWLLTIT